MQTLFVLPVNDSEEKWLTRRANSISLVEPASIYMRRTSRQRRMFHSKLKFEKRLFALDEVDNSSYGNIRNIGCLSISDQIQWVVNIFGPLTRGRAFAARAQEWFEVFQRSIDETASQRATPMKYFRRNYKHFGRELKHRNHTYLLHSVSLTNKFYSIVID